MNRVVVSDRPKPRINYTMAEIREMTNEVLGSMVAKMHEKACLRNSTLDPVEQSLFLKLSEQVLKASVVEANMRANEPEIPASQGQTILLPNKQLAEAIRAAKRERDNSTSSD